MIEDTETKETEPSESADSNADDVKVPDVGQHVIYVDRKGNQQDALVIAVHGTAVSLRTVNADGFSISHTSLPHKGDDDGFYWCWPDEVE